MTPLERKTILLVEDEAILAMAEKKTLERYGFNVISVNNGERAVESVDTTPGIDLILMDIDLGKGIDGTQAAEFILEKHDLPLIFLSSHIEPDIVERTEWITSYGYIVKSSGETVLITSIKMAFRLFETRKREKENEAALRGSELRYRTLFEQANEGIMYLSMDLKVYLVNESFARMHGYSVEEMLTMSLKDLDTPETARTRSARGALLLKDGFLTFEAEHYHKDGHIIPLEVSSSIITIGDEKIILGFHRDITERKLAEESLTRERNLLRTLINYLPESVSIYIKDTEARYVINNAAHLRSLGATCQEDVIGKTSVDFFPREQAAGFLADEQKVVRTGESLVDKLERVYNKALAEERWHSTAKAPLRDSAGKVVGLVGMSTDITERKRAEEDRRRKELQHELVLNTLPMVFYTSRAAEDLATTWMSPQVEAMSGYKAENFVQDSMFWSQRVHPEDRDSVLPSYANIFETGWADCEYRWQCADGSYRWFRDHLILARNENGEPTEAVGIWIDINERKKIEHALQQKERYQRALLDNFPFAVWLKDTESRFLSVNAGFVRTFGAHDSNELIGKTDFDIAPRDMAEGYRADDCTVMESREKKNVEELVLTGGVRNWFETYKAPVMDENGGLLGTVGFARDITERKRAEEVLRESEERHRSILNASPDAIAITDLEGHILMVSSAGVAMFGSHPMEDLHGLSISDFIVPEDRARASSNIALMFQGIMTGLGEYRALRTDGNIFDVEVNGEFIRDADGQPAQMVFVLRDITERKRVEDVLRKSEKDYRQLFDNATDVVIIFEPEQETILEANAAACAIYGFEHDELIGMSLKTFTKDVLTGEAQIKSTMESGMFRNFETIQINKSGHEIHFQVNASTVEYQGKKAILSINRDITDRKQAEKNLREIITKNPMSVQILDKDGFTLEVNNSFTSLFGSVPPPGYSIFSDIQFAQQGLSEIFEKLRTGEIVRFPDVCFNPHDSIAELQDVSVWTRTIGFPLTDSNDEPEKFVLMHENITERKRAEENIQKLLREKELLLQEVHHRVKNNMNAMMSLLSLQADSTKNRETAAMLNNAKNRMRSMQVLYNKLYRSQNIGAVSMKEYFPQLIDEIISNLPSQFEVKVNTKIDEFNLDSKTLIPIGIIMNELLTNVMKYAFAGKTEGLITITASLNGTHARISIQDDGVGIPDPIDIGSSSGFGLQLVDMLAKQLDATIRIERGNGTKFVLEFSV